MKRILITGASGFVGANLLRRLLQQGHETHVILRRQHQPWRLAGLFDSFQKHELDVGDYDAMAALVHAIKPEWVFHLAAYGAYPSQLGFRRMLETNVMGAAALLDASSKAGVEVYIQTGSSSEYGYKAQATEETERLDPNSHYAITKAAATHYCQFTAKTLNLNAITLRLYSIYGPYEHPNRLVPSLILHGLRQTFPPLVSPRTARDFLYIDDAVDAILCVANSNSMQRGAVYNVCSGIQTSLGEIVDVAARVLQIPGRPAWSTMEARSWDSDKWVGSPERIKKDLDWTACVDLETGLRRTIKWFRDYPELNELYTLRLFKN